MIVLPQIVQRSIRKGGGGFVPKPIKSRQTIRSTGDAGRRKKKKMNHSNTFDNLLSTNSEIELHSQSVPNVKYVYPSNQASLYIHYNDNENNNDGPLSDEDENDNPEERINELASNLFAKPPKKSSIKAFSYPQDSQPLLRRPSVTYLPFALRPLPLLQKVVSGKGRMSISTMKTKNVRPSNPVRKTRFQEVAKVNKITAASSFANIWWRDEPGGSSQLLQRGKHFTFLHNANKRRTETKRVTRRFPSGFQRIKRSNVCYYGR
jgi:hypothetical protein